MKNQFYITFILVILSFHVAAETCDDHFTVEALTVIKAKQFIIDDRNERNKTAINLLACIGHPNPAIRDDIVYSGLSQWLRQDKLDTSTVKSLFKVLLQNLSLSEGQNIDPKNFTKPFSALILSEVVRVDRISPYLSPQERFIAVNASAAYMNSITDYRGFDDTEGWRHSVAHTADIFLQLALNEKISKIQLSTLLSALQHQISPQNGHFYQYGEPKRLAMAFIYIVLRGEHSAKELNDYLADIASPSPFADWDSVYTSNSGLAKLHNTRAFIYSIYANTAASKNSKLRAIQASLKKLIQQLG